MAGLVTLGEGMPGLNEVKQEKRTGNFDEGNSRFDAETWLVDGGMYSSPATIYESQDEYEKIVSIKKAGGRFAESVRDQYGHTPKGVTEEAIEQAAKLLNIWSEE